MSSLTRARVIVRGEVQKTGYRDFVQDVARRLNVNGVVRNLKDGTVEVVCECAKGVLEQFLREIKVKRDFINVKDILVAETLPATGEFTHFEIQHGSLEEEFGDRMVAAIKYAGVTHQAVKEMHGDLKNGFADTRREIKAMHGDLTKGFTDTKRAVKAMHGDLRKGLTATRQEVKGMRLDMNKNFREMAERYDAISRALLETRKELIRAIDNQAKLIEEFIRGRRRAHED